ncbi:MAG: D-glycero-beta-D-manno-heptose 1-phosphate adenylyltransferase [Aquificae bacterium]|nr:D-glycero-beta-D-manno-heptose 1-phosphate adenylyltransferase [Aquificota bacterium]
MGKILPLEELLKVLKPFRGKKKIVFTNGCFDILHAGHVHYLNECKKLGDILIVGINSDGSIKRLKGKNRPILELPLRAFVLSNLCAVDYVVPFEEDTPLKLIEAIKPDVLVKGGDWEIDQIVGKDIVQSYGGKVLTIPFKYQISTSQIIERILERYCPIKGQD